MEGSLLSNIFSINIIHILMQINILKIFDVTEKHYPKMTSSPNNIHLLIFKNNNPS
jgi:hypothetical protein